MPYLHHSQNKLADKTNNNCKFRPDQKKIKPNKSAEYFLVILFCPRNFPYGYSIALCTQIAKRCSSATQIGSMLPDLSDS